MPLQFQCPKCHQLISAPREYVGKAIDCPKCKTRLIVPGGESTSAAGQTTQPNDSLIGKKIAHYEIESLLGRGAMGKVYKAHNLRLDKTCAIKILPPEFARQDEAHIDRFVLEARAAAKVEHPNVLPVQNVGKVGENYLIEMQYIDGGTLEDALSSKGKLEVNEAARIVREIASGLMAAHQQGIIHRDIKPSNVMLTKDGRALVADFGLARTVEQSTALTTSGMLLGTPVYMSPEQWQGMKADHRSDIYSLGVMFYRMLAGKPPYDAPNLMGLLNQHLRAAVPDVRRQASGVPDQLALMIKKMMSKRPQDRTQTCTEIVQELNEFLGVPSVITPSGLRKGKLRERPKRRLLAPVVVGVMAILIVLAGGIFYVSQRRAKEAEPTPRKEPVVRKPAPSKAEEQLPKAAKAPQPSPPVEPSVVTPPPQKPEVAPEPEEETTKPPEPKPSAAPKPKTPRPEPGPYDDVYVTTAATGEKIPHPLSRKTYTIEYEGKTIEVPEGMVFVPAGPFIMGDDEDPIASPAHEVDVDAFFIDEYEVTNAQYMEFVKATGYAMPEHWVNNHGKIPEGRENHPVTYVSWYDAKAYCDWCGKRLPTEAEWEKAAGWDMSSSKQQEYPWGDKYDDGKANLCYHSGCPCGGDSGKHKAWWDKWRNSPEGKKVYSVGGPTSPVGRFKGDLSFFGCFDMAGNVTEAVADSFQEEYYNVGPKKNPRGPPEENAERAHDGQPYRVGRGGNYYVYDIYARTTHRWRRVSTQRTGNRGFRCAADYPWKAAGEKPVAVVPEAGVTAPEEAERLADLADYLEDIKPANERIDHFDYETARARANLWKLRYPEMIEMKVGNIDRIIAMRKRCFDRVNRGKVKVSMADVSRRYAFAGEIRRADEKGLTAAIKKDWEGLTKEEIADFYAAARDPESADDFLGIAAFLMEGNASVQDYDRAVDMLAKAKELGADPSSFLHYIDTLKRLQGHHAEGGKHGRAPETPAPESRAGAPPPPERGVPAGGRAQRPSPTNYDDVYVTTAATGDKIPHPLSRKTYKIVYQGKPIEVPEGMVFVPAGPFIMGDDKDERASPAHEVDVDAFFMDKYEVTNAQYWEFVEATGHAMPKHFRDNGGRVPMGRESHPVNFVSWEDAKAYCDWCGKRLPSEAEWEKTASWDSERQKKRNYPWGDNLDDATQPMANRAARWGYMGGSLEKWREAFEKSKGGKQQMELGGGTTPVGTFERGISPYSCHDMAGNVIEWVRDWFDRYPGNTKMRAGEANLCGQKRRVLHGGSWYSISKILRCSFRFRDELSRQSCEIGFRCAADYPWKAPEVKKERAVPKAESPESKAGPYDGVYVTTAATGDKIPHPLSRRTYKIIHKGKRIEVPEGMVLVPAGTFIMGYNNSDVSSPEHEIHLDSFFIEKYEVTNTQYMEFVKATGHRMPSHFARKGGQIPEKRENHPVTCVSWDDAKAYCDWCRKRLPTEAEWEKAARWDPQTNRNYTYPWGNEKAPERLVANSATAWGRKLGMGRDDFLASFKKGNEGKHLIGLGGATMPVGVFPYGVSPNGCYDMAGNVWEWVEDWYDGYPGNTQRIEDFGRLRRVVRGGSWYDLLIPSHGRGRNPQQLRGYAHGFRCAADCK